MTQNNSSARPPVGRRRTIGRAAVMVAAASALVSAVQVTAAGGAEAAGCTWYGSECIEEVVVTGSRERGWDDPYDREYPYPSDDGDGYPEYVPGTGSHGCIPSGDSCIEVVITTAPLPDPFGRGMTKVIEGWFHAMYVYFIGSDIYNPPRDELINAYGLVSELLEKPECNAVVSGPTRDARHTARFSMFHDSRLPGRDMHGRIASYATAYTPSRGPDAGNAYVTIYETFFNVDDPGLMGRTDLIEPPSRLEQQALILLHEIGHVTGATVHTRAMDERGEMAPVNARIADVCLGLVRH